LPGLFEGALILAFSLREKGSPLPLGESGGEGKGKAGTASFLSTKGENVLSTLNFPRICMMTQSAAAPEKMRTKVKVAASMPVCFSAARQSSELLANAIIANTVRKKTRTLISKTFEDGQAERRSKLLREVVPGADQKQSETG
jgi:hypothetical protein